jgi:hypothetical protein
LAGSK